MRNRLNLIVYDDSPVFGGHQVMACHAIRALSKDSSIELTILRNPENERLDNHLQTIASEGGSLRIADSPVSTKRFQGIRNYYSRGEVSTLSKVISSRNPDALLCIQGDIEGSSLALIAARNLNIRLISYIPVPHTLSIMNAKAGLIRDWANSKWFAYPDAYITISASMETLLRERGVTAPIKVVQNGIDTSRFGQIHSRSEMRNSMGIPEEATVLGCVGRIEFKQKGQDFLLKTFAENKEIFEGHNLAFIGSGPDETKLESMIAELGLSGKARIHPWTERMHELYTAMDALAIPSRFEGVPLVMLEALATGIPVIGSDRDGMRDMLPESLRFRFGDADDLCRAYREAIGSGKPIVKNLSERIKSEMTIDNFQRNFACELLNLVAN